MSSVLAMILVAGLTVPGDVPKEVSWEVEERLDLSGKWEGNVSHQEGISIDAFLEGGRLVEWAFWMMNDPTTAVSYQVSISGDVPGRFRLTLNGERYVGIYKRSSDAVILCYRLAGRGYPTSFRVGNGQHLLTLRPQPLSD
jgi:hypothetical protein